MQHHDKLPCTKVELTPLAFELKARDGRHQPWHVPLQQHRFRIAATTAPEGLLIQSLPVRGLGCLSVVAAGKACGLRPLHPVMCWCGHRLQKTCATRLEDVLFLRTADRNSHRYNQARSPKRVILFRFWANSSSKKGYIWLLTTMAGALHVWALTVGSIWQHLAEPIPRGGFELHRTEQSSRKSTLVTPPYCTSSHLASLLAKPSRSNIWRRCKPGVGRR